MHALTTVTLHWRHERFCGKQTMRLFAKFAENIQLLHVMLLLLRRYDACRQAFLFYSCPSLFLFLHPDSNLLDGLETSPQKDIRGFVLGRTRKIHSHISHILLLNFTGIKKCEIRRPLQSPLTRSGFEPPSIMSEIKFKTFTWSFDDWCRISPIPPLILRERVENAKFGLNVACDFERMQHI